MSGYEVKTYDPRILEIPTTTSSGQLSDPYLIRIGGFSRLWHRLLERVCIGCRVSEESLATQTWHLENKATYHGFLIMRDNALVNGWGLGGILEIRDKRVKGHFVFLFYSIFTIWFLTVEPVSQSQTK